MDAKLKLERYFYLGTLEPVFIKRKQQKLIARFTYYQLDSWITQIDGDNFVRIVQKCLKHAIAPRRDEVWFCYAAYLYSTIGDEEKVKVKEGFPKCAKTDTDLFIFANYCKALATLKKKKHINYYAKGAIILWYNQQDPAYLVESWSARRSYYGFEHKDLFFMCHIPARDLKFPNIFEAYFKRCSKIIKGPLTSDGEPDCAAKIALVSALKSTESEAKAKEIIKENNLKFENVPTHLLHSLSVWESLIPTMSYVQLLKSAHTLIEKHMLDNVAFCQFYLKAIGNRALMISENIHPVVFLLEKNKLINQVRYSEHKKSEYYKKKINRLKIKGNTFLNKKIAKIYGHSFDNYKGNGIRTFVTFNLQQNYRKKVVSSQKQITCHEAAITLAFTYFKSEKTTDVYTFTPENVKLSKVEWKKNWNLHKANEHCIAIMTKKNSQKLQLPILTALSKRQVYDLFLVIVPSAARGNPGNKPEFLLKCLNKYKETINPKARMVIVNLRRYKPAMTHMPYKDDGILEICGFEESTPQLINAFALNLFS